MSSVAIHTALQQHPAPGYLAWPARLLSIIFHPIFVPLYVGAFIAYVHPSYFAGLSDTIKLRSMLVIVQNAIFYPLFSIVLLKALGFIDSIFLHTKKDRIIPYMACGIFFFWTFTVFKEQAMFPRILPSFMLGVFLASSAALIANIYYKISMHAIALGGWLGIFLIIARDNSMLMTWPIALVLLITGLVCTARLLVSDHTNKDIYSGIVVGLLCQFIAAYVML